MGAVSNSGATRRVTVAGSGGEELRLDTLLRELKFLEAEGVDLASVRYSIRTKGFSPMMIKEIEVEFDYGIEDSSGIQPV